MFVHLVFFWLKDDADEGSRQRLCDDCRTMLPRIPTVRQLFAGLPADGPARPVLESSYSVGLCVLFDDRAGHETYQTHQLHLDFIARHKASWKRVQVYDFQ